MQTKSCEKEHGYWLNFFMCNLSTANTAAFTNCTANPDVLRCGVVVGRGLCSKATAAHATTLDLVLRKTDATSRANSVTMNFTDAVSKRATLSLDRSA